LVQFKYLHLKLVWQSEILTSTTVRKQKGTKCLGLGKDSEVLGASYQKSHKVGARRSGVNSQETRQRASCTVVVASSTIGRLSEAGLNNSQQFARYDLSTALWTPGLFSFMAILLSSSQLVECHHDHHCHNNFTTAGGRGDVPDPL
jgi:hypothetical protein